MMSNCLINTCTSVSDQNLDIEYLTTPTPPSKIEIIYTSAILLNPSDCSWVRYPSGDFRSIISDIAQDLCSSNCFHNSSSVSPTLKGPPCFELSVRPCNLQCRRKKYKYQGFFLALRFLRELLPPKEILK